MGYLLAKALEVSGMMTVMWGLFMGLSGRGLFVEVAMLALGSAVFYLGRFLEQRSARPG
jgi:hypothetical protein